MEHGGVPPAGACHPPDGLQVVLHDHSSGQEGKAEEEEEGDEDRRDEGR